MTSASLTTEVNGKVVRASYWSDSRELFALEVDGDVVVVTENAAEFVRLAKQMLRVAEFAELGASS